MGVPQVRWMVKGTSQSKMDDDWGYPHDETETSTRCLEAEAADRSPAELEPEFLTAGNCGEAVS